MPLPPCDFTALHAPLGIRGDVLNVSPVTKFVPPAVLLSLQKLCDSGTPLALQLTEQSWMALACMDEIACSHAIAAAMRYSHTSDIALINATLGGFAAAFFNPSNMFAPPPPPPPPPPEPASPRNKGIEDLALAMRRCVSDGRGKVTWQHFNDVLAHMNALGAPSAAKAVREFHKQHLAGTDADDVSHALKTVMMAHLV